MLIDEFRYELMATTLIPCVSVERHPRLNWMSGPLDMPLPNFRLKNVLMRSFSG